MKRTVLILTMALLCAAVTNAQKVTNNYLVSSPLIKAGKPAKEVVKPYFRFVAVSLPTNCVTDVVQAGPIQYCITSCSCQCWNVSYYVSNGVPIPTSITPGTGCGNSCSTTQTQHLCNESFTPPSVYDLAQKWLIENTDQDGVVKKKK